MARITVLLLSWHRSAISAGVSRRSGIGRLPCEVAVKEVGVVARFLRERGVVEDLRDGRGLLAGDDDGGLAGGEVFESVWVQDVLVGAAAGAVFGVADAVGAAGGHPRPLGAGEV